jgi:hypothetical protein
MGKTPWGAHGKNTMGRPWKKRHGTPMEKTPWDDHGKNAMGRSWAQATRRYENLPDFQGSHLQDSLFTSIVC